jgi:two-component system, OmpR family, phosphate regulon response regulator PhoB
LPPADAPTLGATVVVSPPRGHYTVGPLELDVDNHRVSVGGIRVAMSRMELRLLADLVEHRGRIRTRDDLLSEVWGYSLRVTTRTPIIHVARLRAKLGDAAELIETVYGAGYRLSDRYPVVQRVR